MLQITEAKTVKKMVDISPIYLAEISATMATNANIIVLIRFLYGYSYYFSKSTD